jgi:hypothetical protein
MHAAQPMLAYPGSAQMPQPSLGMPLPSMPLAPPVNSMVTSTMTPQSSVGIIQDSQEDQQVVANAKAQKPGKC